MIVAWIFVVLPAIFTGIDVKSKTISRTTKNKRNLFVINFGLRIGALFQFLFLIYLIGKFNLSYLSLTVVLYFSTIVATLVVSFTPIYKNTKLHQRSAYYYFSTIPIFLILFGLSIKDTYNPLSKISILIAALYLIGMLLINIKIKKENALSEIWAFLMLSIWTIIITFI